MGVRVHFYFGSPDGLESLFWGADLQRFLDWAVSVRSDDPETFSSEWLDKVDAIVTGGPPAPIPVDHHEAEVIDSVFDGFFFSYCDTSAGPSLRTASEAMFYVRRYREARARIESVCSLQTSRCWGHLLEGRAVGRPLDLYPYKSSDEASWLGYWTAEEVRCVHDDLCRAFPEAVRRRSSPSDETSSTATDDEIPFEVAWEATSAALREDTGLILIVI